MKKTLIILVAVLMGSFAMAQTNLGVRLGGGDGFGGELSGQFGLGGNRLEADLGWTGGDHWSYINLSGIYQWTGNITGPLGWYAGIGANLGLYGGDNEAYKAGLGLGVALQAGLELNLNIPFQFTLDVRPSWGFIGHSGFGWGAALGIRYKL